MKRFADLVVLPHSVFALPFALSALCLAWRRGPTVPVASQPWWLVLGVVGCVVAARTAAMSFNRLVDADIDAANPRTDSREIPKGLVSRWEAGALCALSSIVFICLAGLLGRHCLVLAPGVLLVLLGYSLSKRVTSSAHLVLGVALALAPGGAWWVVRPQLDWSPILLMAGVVLWVAGFDILYATQDVLFDRKRGMFSIAAMLGIESAFAVSRIFHGASFFLFALMGQLEHLSWHYFVGLTLIGAVLLVEHCIISPFDLSRINRAFFTCNGVISFLYLAAVWSSVTFG